MSWKQHKERMERAKTAIEAIITFDRRFHQCMACGCNKYEYEGVDKPRGHYDNCPLVLVKKSLKELYEIVNQRED